MSLGLYSRDVVAAWLGKRVDELERDQVMGKTWACVGFASDLPKNG